ncbi:hypothetical protein [Bythopirellula polymerisocia]|uniref:Uncharacterized protein n=1 Tax=Bythopirellula polymerisocia TaxID=2528003 RepID=A0A5C6CN35_9BACT|nr:hypothetical protein [Bythopirellula polymerisocia]TWU25960.1 hypothetical protein Pla144_31740 [Bythopirellula polymerisocia]
MRKSIVLSACLAICCVIGQVHAAEGVIPSNTLDAMGLSGVKVVSDSTAAEVRGMGYVPISIAAGGSFAGVGSHHAAAGSVNGYFAAGKYAASGANGSEAGITKVHVKSIDIGGVTKTITTTKSISVYAGGYSSAMSF